MKKTALSLVVAVIVAAACNKEPENHLMRIEYPTTGMALIYADQTEDSVSFVTTESWRIISTQPWCYVAEGRNAFTNPYEGYFVLFTVPVQFSPNTTSSYRTALLNVEGGEYTSTACYVQTDFLNITRPGRYIYSDLSGDSIRTLTDSAFVVRDSITFTTYGGWTLTASNGSWIHLQQSEGNAGQHTVQINLDPNTTSEDRRDTLWLTSKGVKDYIPCLQYKEKNM